MMEEFHWTDFEWYLSNEVEHAYLGMIMFSEQAKPARFEQLHSIKITGKNSVLSFRKWTDNKIRCTWPGFGYYGWIFIAYHENKTIYVWMFTKSNLGPP